MALQTQHILTINLTSLCVDGVYDEDKEGKVIKSLAYFFCPVWVPWAAQE